MAVIEWEGEIRLTIGYIRRSAQLDLWTIFSDSEWSDIQAPEGEKEEALYLTRRLMETDAMVAAVATRQIEVCKDGKWVVLKAGKTHTIDAAGFTIGFPPTHDMINECPRQLADDWVAAAVEKNGSLNANLHFFSSLTVPNGKPSSEPISDEPPSNTPKTTKIS